MNGMHKKIYLAVITFSDLNMQELKTSLTQSHSLVPAKVMQLYLPHHRVQRIILPTASLLFNSITKLIDCTACLT